MNCRRPIAPSTPHCPWLRSGASGMTVIILGPIVWQARQVARGRHKSMLEVRKTARIELAEKSTDFHRLLLSHL